MDKEHRDFKNSLKEDELQHVAGSVVHFFNNPDNINKLVNWLIGAAVVALLIWGYMSYKGNIDSNVYKSVMSAKEKIAAKDFETAIMNFKTMLKDYPGSKHTGEIYYLLGQCYETTKNNPEAIKAYGESLKYGLPAELKPAAHMSYIYALEANSEYVKAAEACEAFLKKMPKYYGAGEVLLTEARNLRLAGKVTEAMAKYQEIMVKYPDSTWASTAKPYVQ